MHLASSTWDSCERAAILKVVESGQYTMGERVSDFERAYADFVGSKYCVMVNSGSSANLLMVAAYTLRYGADTVIVPALAWSTSYSPFQQYGWKLHFVDIDRETLNYDLSGLWKAVEKYDDPLILAVNVLGNPNEYLGFPRKCHILEDNCESMGAMYEGGMTGTFGKMSSHSCFFAHHICTMEGGMVTTDDEYFYHMLLSLRSHGWTRHLPKDNALRAEVESWNFILPGYNVRPIEMMGAIGLEQLKKLPKIISQRRRNAQTFPLKAQKEIGESSWYGFALLSDDPEFKTELERVGVEHRPVISGNFLRHPAIKHYNYVSDPLPNADFVHDHGVMIGNHAQPIDWSILDPLVHRFRP